jgi:hypothetical protein
MTGVDQVDFRVNRRYVPIQAPAKVLFQSSQKPALPHELRSSLEFICDIVEATLNNSNYLSGTATCMSSSLA